MREPRGTPEQTELSRLRAENVRLKRANELLKKRWRTLHGTHPVRDVWIEGPRKVDPVDEMCRVLAVSERGDRAWKQGGTLERGGGQPHRG